MAVHDLNDGDRLHWLHEWFPPEQLVGWRTHGWRASMRLLPFVLTPWLLAVPAIYFNSLLFGYEMSWIWILIGVLPGFIALAGVLVMAGTFTQAVFGRESWRTGFRYALLCMFGRPWPFIYPYAIITEGGVRDKDQNKFLADRRLGGPGSLLIFTDSAVVLERYGRISRVHGPGAVFLERFERIREIMDLRPQTKTVSAKVYTKDGIAVETEITVRFQIKRGTPASAENPYPVDPAALEKAAKAQTRRIAPTPPPLFDWKGRVLGNVDSTLRAIVAGKTLDELFEPTDANKDPRNEISREMLRLLNDDSADFGAEVLDVLLGPFKPVSTLVEQQRLASWQAARRAEDRVKEAYGEAQAMLTRETAYAYAQLEMMLAIDRGFRRLVSQDKNLPSYFVALRFIETLRRTATSAGVGSLLPQESIRTLEFLNRLLAPPLSSNVGALSATQPDSS